MKERPILFSGLMVRAILDGRKTQTRRVVRGYDGDTDEHGRPMLNARGCEFRPLRSPYGEPGDRLWVRETWGARDIRGCFAERIDEIDVATDTIVFRENYEGAMPAHGRWFPSIHMPRWASRIALEVVSVRVERLQDITDDDARAEGPVLCGHDCGDGRGHFQALWDSINGERAPWASNPWVWAVEFRRLNP